MVIRRALLAAALLLASPSAWAQSTLEDDDPFTVNTTRFGPVGCVVDDTATDTIQENRAGVWRCTVMRAAHVNLRNVAGTEIGTVAAPVNAQISDGTETATVRDTGSSDSLNVSIVDANGNQVSAFGGSGGTAQTDDTAFTPATSVLTPSGGIVSSDTVDSGDTGAFRMTVTRDQMITVRDAAGDSAMDDTNDALRTTTLAVTPGTAAANLGKAEDLAHATGDTLVGLAGVRNDSGGTTFTSANGDYSPISVDSAGRIIISPTGGSNGTTADNNAFTGGTTAVFPSGFIFDATPPVITDGTVGGARMNANRDIRVAAVDSQGDDATDTTNNAVKMSIVACGPCNATFGSAAPTGGHAIGGTDGTNLQIARVADGDTGGGTQNQLAVIPMIAASGGAVPIPGSAADGQLVNLGTNNDVTVTGTVSDVPATSGGLLVSSLVSAATNNATVVKASAGQVYSITAFNINAAVRYIKLYNKATAPTCGTDVPVARFAIPGNTAGAGFQIPIPSGVTFATGIGFCIVTGIADADNTAVAANELIANVMYK